MTKSTHHNITPQYPNITPEKKKCSFTSHHHSIHHWQFTTLHRDSFIRRKKKDTILFFFSSLLEPLPQKNYIQNNNADLLDLANNKSSRARRILLVIPVLGRDDNAALADVVSVMANNAGLRNRDQAEVWVVAVGVAEVEDCGKRRLANQHYNIGKDVRKERKSTYQR